MTRDRERFDWSNLVPLPRKTRHREDREALAERKFHAHKAKHKGRNHIDNWKRRQIVRAKKQESADAQAKRIEKAKSFIDRVRGYWSGERDEHP